MYRVKKINGWNRYKVQRRFLFIFWLDVHYSYFCSKGAAIVFCAKLTSKG